MSNKEKIIKELIIYFICTVLVSALGFIISLLYSKMFSPEEYGVYSLAYNTYVLISQLLGGWISLSILRNAKVYKENSKYDSFFGTFLILNLFLSIIFIILINTIISLLDISIEIRKMFISLSFMYFFEQGISIINTNLRVEQKAKKYSFNNVINNVIKIALLLFIYYIIGYKNVTVIIISLLLSEIMQFSYLFIKYNYIKIFKLKNFNIKIVKDMFMFGFPLIGLSITNWVLNVSDRYIITFFRGMEESGMYSYAYSMGNSLFNLLIQFIMLGAYPSIVKTWEDKGKEETEKLISKYLDIYFLINIPAAIGVVCISKDFFSLFINERYYQAYTSFYITCLAIVILGITQYYNKAWELTKRTSTVLKLNILAAIINIIINLLFIPKYGYVIGAISTLISYIIYLIVAMILSSKTINIKINIKYLTKTIIASLIMTVVYNIITKLQLKINLYVLFIFKMIAAIVVYTTFSIIFKLIDIKTIKEIIKKKIKKE